MLKKETTIRVKRFYDEEGKLIEETKDTFIKEYDEPKAKDIPFTFPQYELSPYKMPGIIDLKPDWSFPIITCSDPIVDCLKEINTYVSKKED